MADKVKFALAVLLVLAGIVGFHLLAEQMLVVRVQLGLGDVAAGVAVAWRTEQGARFGVFLGEVLTETKKVVWPTRKETFQTTGIVFVFVVVLAIFLWLTDKSLEWVLYDLVLGWK